MITLKFPSSHQFLFYFPLFIFFWGGGGGGQREGDGLMVGQGSHKDWKTGNVVMEKCLDLPDPRISFGASTSPPTPTPSTYHRQGVCVWVCVCVCVCREGGG